MRLINTAKHPRYGKPAPAEPTDDVAASLPAPWEARGRKLFTLGRAIHTPPPPHSLSSSTPLTIQLDECCLWAVLAHWNAIIAPSAEFSISCPSAEPGFQMS